MQVAAAVLTMHNSSCTAVWCGVCGLGKYYVGQKPARAAGRMTRCLTGR